MSSEHIFDKYTPVYIHLSCDNFEEDLMLRDLETGQYQVLRMVPPGEIRYYFTIGDHKTIDRTQDRVKNHLYSDEKHIEIPYTNIFHNIEAYNDVINETLLEDLTAIPRPPQKVCPYRKRQKEPWIFEKSVFKDAQHDNPDILKKCFEFDWKTSKIDKVLLKCEDEENEKI